MLLLEMLTEEPERWVIDIREISPMFMLEIGEKLRLDRAVNSVSSGFLRTGGKGDLMCLFK
jgi:hypothetical protein